MSEKPDTSKDREKGLRDALRRTRERARKKSKKKIPRKEILAGELQEISLKEFSAQHRALIWESRLHGERVALVPTTKHAQLAGDLVWYTAREAMYLIERGFSEKFLRDVHRIKRMFGGVVQVPRQARD